ncbi:MAG: hypothetical protein R6V54_04515 [Desulfobacteraceae bacterium]
MGKFSVPHTIPHIHLNHSHDIHQVMMAKGSPLIHPDMILDTDQADVQ